MLKKIGDFSYKRNLLGAVAFYLLYGSIGIFLCGVITSMLIDTTISSIEDAKIFAMRVAPIIGGIYTFLIALSIIILKHLSKDALAILCAIVGAFASASLGLIFGFIPVAVLSTFSVYNTQKLET